MVRFSDLQRKQFCLLLHFRESNSAPLKHNSSCCRRHLKPIPSTTIPANCILWDALNPEFEGIPHEWAKEASAVVMLTTVQAGLVVTGTLGMGIIVCKKPCGGWSNPSACALVGGGVGLSVGCSYKNVLIFVKGQDGLNAVTSEHGLTLGGGMETTLGRSGHSTEVDVQVSNRGVGTSYAVAFAKGAMFGVSLQGAVVGARLAANKSFYDSDATPRQILMDDTAVAIPRDSVYAMDEVYSKLIALTSCYEAENEGEEEPKEGGSSTVQEEEEAQAITAAEETIPPPAISAA